MENLNKMALIEILENINYTNQYLDSISVLIDIEPNPDKKFQMIKEMHNAERYYRELEQEIKNRWGIDLEDERKL